MSHETSLKGTKTNTNVSKKAQHMSNIFMQGAHACLTSPCFKFLMILFTESKYKSGSLAMRIWLSYDYRFLLHLYLCGEISLPLSLGSISLEPPWGQPAADWWETSPKLANPSRDWNNTDFQAVSKTDLKGSISAVTVSQIKNLSWEGLFF